MSTLIDLPLQRAQPAIKLVLTATPVALAEMAAAVVGAPGTGGGGSSSGAELFVQNSAPAAAGAYLWVQTGLGVGGGDATFWIEDGL